MTTSKEHAERAVAALAGRLRPGADTAEVASIIEQALDAAGATAQQHMSQLLSASPAVIYSFKARDDFAPTFVSDNIKALFGYEPSAYLDNSDFWRERVHPDDLVKDEVDAEEQEQIKVKGFAEPIRRYKVLGLYDDLVSEGSVIREDRDGFKLLLDLKKRDRAEAVAALEAIVARLKK